MKRRWYRWILLAVLAVLVWLIWDRLAERGPFYHGKSINHWFNDRDWMQGEAMDAFRELV